MRENDSGKITVPVVFGPTGVGKSDVISELSKKRSISLVSADSIQIYRGLNVGSAKPSPEERASYPHYLIDVREPEESFDVADFVELANEAVSGSLTSGRVPVISGGTAFYIKNYVFGLSAAPECNPVIRREIEAEIAEKGVGSVLDYLRSVDPVSASRIDARNVRRLVRAAEVCRSSGRPFSSFSPVPSFRDEYDFKLVGLVRGRDSLRCRISRRLDAMFASGLEDEVRGLRDRGLGLSFQSMGAIGYREFFDASLRTASEIRDKIYYDTVHYAKRQMTFFRSFDGVEWIDLDETDAASCAERISDMLPD